MRTQRGVFRRGKVWYVSWQDEFGRRHREAVGSSHKEAVQAREQRLADSRAGRFGWKRTRQSPTLTEFVEEHWRPETEITLKPSTRAAYDWLLRRHLLPAFGDNPLPAITRADVRAFIVEKAKQQRLPKGKRANPTRPTLALKTIRNAVALLAGILESAATDYDLLPDRVNPLRGILRRKNFPMGNPKARPQFLEPEDFLRAVNALRPADAELVLFAALSGLRWGELTALRAEEDIDLRRNKITVTHSLYRRTRQRPKTGYSVRDVDMCPTVRHILERKRRERASGFVFSKDGKTPIGLGPWIKNNWRKAQAEAGIRQPIRWHDLRHEFVALMIAAGKHPKYISQQAGHASAGFTLDRYGHLFDTMRPRPVEWIDDLLGGWDQIGTKLDGIRRLKAGERPLDRVANPQVGSGVRD